MYIRNQNLFDFFNIKIIHSLTNSGISPKQKLCINNSYIANAEILSNNSFLASAYLVHEKKNYMRV